MAAKKKDLTNNWAAEFADYPQIAILERRMESPDDPGTQPILLKDDPTPSCAELQHYAQSKGNRICVRCKVPFRKWYTRWINATVPNRLHGVEYNKGYVKVFVDELRNKDQVSDLAATLDQTVRRGEKGSGVLVKIPFPLYCEIKLKELGRRLARDKSAKLMRDDLADATGAALGDEAGDSVSKFVTEYKRPKSTVQEELAES